MKIFKYLIVFITVMLYSNNSLGQQNVAFDYTVTPIGEGEYEFMMSIPDPGNVQFLEIGFMDSANSEFASETLVASINKKSDNNYYFFLSETEVKINPEEFSFQIIRQQREVGVELNSSVVIKLMDEDLNVLNTYQQVITN